MDTERQKESCLEPYRVLDLTQGGCTVCGKILGDLGADVIMIEKPEGNPTRCLGPFYQDIPDSGKSLFWFAFNCNKRGITLDIESADGREIFKRLVKTADFVIESFPPGYMDGLNIGYPTLSEINPRLIMASITPFGQYGPHAHYKASDLITMAMSGFMNLHGDIDRPPVWITFPQASLEGGADCAAALMIAHWYRQTTGEGQHIDVSIQESVANMLFNAPVWWDISGKNLVRVGDAWQIGAVLVPFGYRCKDGYVSLNLLGGGRPSNVASSVAVVKWMDEEGIAPEWLKSFDWVNEFDTSKISQELVDRIANEIVNFLLTKSKVEIMERALKDNIIVAPVNTAKDIWENQHLLARNFWVKVEHPELGNSLSYCGPFVKMGETPLRINRRPPLIGEHNEEVYEEELHFEREELLLLKQSHVI